MCLTETLLKDHRETPTTIRADRNEHSACKSIGGGLCLFVDNSLAAHYRIREQVCMPDYEILTVSFRPFYLSQEFGQITVILAYVPESNDERE